jgi:polyhydroxyalkanoate synthesis regulator phasin
MAKVLQWKGLVDDGKRVAEVRSSQARQLASDCRAHGEHATHRASASVEELLERRRWLSDELGETARATMQRALGALGLATKDDVSLQGALVTERVCAAVEELGVLTRPNDELHDAVCAEVQRQVGALGVAIKDDLHALERRLTQTATRASSARRAAERGNKVGDERASREEAARQDAGSSDPTDGHPPSTLTTRPL